jgi:hypothetical protein
MAAVSARPARPPAGRRPGSMRAAAVVWRRWAARPAACRSLLVEHPSRWWRKRPRARSKDSSTIADVVELVYVWQGLAQGALGPCGALRCRVGLGGAGGRRDPATAGGHGFWGRAGAGDSHPQRPRLTSWSRRWDGVGGSPASPTHAPPAASSPARLVRAREVAACLLHGLTPRTGRASPGERVTDKILVCPADRPASRLALPGEELGPGSRSFPGPCRRRPRAPGPLQPPAPFQAGRPLANPVKASHGRKPLASTQNCQTVCRVRGSANTRSSMAGETGVRQERVRSAGGRRASSASVGQATARKVLREAGGDLRTRSGPADPHDPAHRRPFQLECGLREGGGEP